MTPTQFVYHGVPSHMAGQTLYPLNQLRQLMPEAAAAYEKKYVGRDELLERRIPLLDCLWNDVLFFSPVHPAEIMQIFREAGYDPAQRCWFEIPLTHLLPAQTVVYDMVLRPFGDMNDVPAEYAWLADCDFIKLSQSTTKLREHIQIAQSENRRPLLFMGVPHILYKGELDIDAIRIIEH